MPYILSAAHIQLPYLLSQEKVMDFSREIFGTAFKDIERLLNAFKNGEVESRYFVNDLNWYKEEHTFEERNNSYIEKATQFGVEVIEKCLSNNTFLLDPIPMDEIEAIYFISSTGMAAPTIDARILNILPASVRTKRIPIWGLGCAGGAAGLARASEYCRAFPNAKVLVLSVELCSLTFQKNDTSKSNLIGTSLFSDGVGCVLICGDEVERKAISRQKGQYRILNSQSTLMLNSLDVMGWDVKDGLYVVFSKDIPYIIKNWLKPTVEGFLLEQNLELKEIRQFIAHPGGKKVIDAYQDSLMFTSEMTTISMDVLREYGNMSSATILYVLERFMEHGADPDEYALAAALGPGFSSELLLMRWER